MSGFYVTLPNRGLIHLEGEDRHAFLQGLVSNDVELLKTQPCVYACLLTAQGKFLHDFFMIEGNGFTLLDCEGGARAQDLFKRLNMYRLRAKVKISVEESVAVYAVFGAAPADGHQDPRHPDMGFRTFNPPQDMTEQPFAVWDEHRIRLGIPDGSRDMAVEQSTLIECNIEKFNGISFDKGCYVGQELTARMHMRGLAKKHLYAVELSTAEPDPGFRRDDKGGRDDKGSQDDNITFPASGEDIYAGDMLAGTMRSSCGNVGLALLKDEMAAEIKAPVKLLSLRA